MVVLSTTQIIAEFLQGMLRDPRSAPEQKHFVWIVDV